MKNVLYIDAGDFLGENHMYPYYGAVYRELTKLVTVHTHQGHVRDMTAFLSNLGTPIDGIIYGLGYFAQRDPDWFATIAGLSELNIPIACMLHKPQTMLTEKIQFCIDNGVSLIADPQYTFEKLEAATSIKTVHLPFTADPDLFQPRPSVSPIYDVGFSGALHGSGKIEGPTQDLRQRAMARLDLLEDYKIFWNGSDSVHTRIDNVEEYARKINECKVWFATTGPVLDMGPRYFEVALSKTLLFCNDMPDTYGDIFVDGETCVTFKNDLSDFDEKLHYYLNHDLERLQIIDRAYDLIVSEYTWAHMARRLLEKMRTISDVS